RVRAEVDTNADLVALPPDAHAGRGTGRAWISGLADEHVQHPPQLGLVTEHGGALAHLELYARLRRNLPHQGGEVDLAAAAARDLMPVQRSEHAHRLVEAVERALHATAALLQDGHRRRGELVPRVNTYPTAQLLRGRPGLLREQPRELVLRESIR